MPGYEAAAHPDKPPAVDIPNVFSISFQRVIRGDRFDRNKMPTFGPLAPALDIGDVMSFFGGEGWSGLMKTRPAFHPDSVARLGRKVCDPEGATEAAER